MRSLLFLILTFCVAGSVQASSRTDLTLSVEKLECQIDSVAVGPILLQQVYPDECQPPLQGGVQPGQPTTHTPPAPFPVPIVVDSPALSAPEQRAEIARQPHNTELNPVLPLAARAQRTVAQSVANRPLIPVAAVAVLTFLLLDMLLYKSSATRGLIQKIRSLGRDITGKRSEYQDK